MALGKEWTVRVTLRAVAALSLVLVVSAFVFADEPTEKPSDTKQSTGAAQPAAARADAKGDAKASTAAEARQVRLTKPWRDLASLSDDQKRQINQIHRKATQEVKAIEQREHDEILALLNDQQKAELKAMLEKDAAAKKAKAAEKSKAGAQASPKNADSDLAAASEEAEADSEGAAGSN